MTHITGRIVRRGHSEPTPATLTISAGRITAITELPADAAHTELPIIFPGFTDIHNHGGAGESFPNSDYEGCRRAARHHLSFGTTQLLASLVSAPEEVLLRQTKILARLAEEGDIVGIHMEGPFVNHCRCGAQDPAAIIPGDPELLQKVARAGNGYLRSVTFAPETDNALALVDVCAEHNIIASLGHTDADADLTWQVIEYAIDQGVTVTATHLFNAMPQIHHRQPGAAAALLDAAARGKAVVELVADGVHLHDGIVNMVRNSAPNNAMFITDAMAAAGMSDGDYQLGALAVTVADGVARLTHGGAIAGGTSTIYDQLRRHTTQGWALADMVGLVSSTAADLLGLNAGDLAVGKDANVVVMDEDLTLREVYRRGELITA